VYIFVYFLYQCEEYFNKLGATGDHSDSKLHFMAISMFALQNIFTQGFY